MAKRRARQTPTQKVVLPYKTTRGPKAVKLYNLSGNRALAWQKEQLNNILAINSDGLYVHQKYGYAVPRRNGKGEILIIRELYALINGEKVLHTAHLSTTSSSAAYRLARCLDNMGYEEIIRFKKGEVYNKHYVFHKQFGLEKIEVLSPGGGSVNFRTRTSRGGLGEGYDVLIIDEAQEYQDDQESSLKYVVSDSKNPQTIYTGTPPTAVSAGTKFVKYRNDVLNRNLEDSGWAEWSVETETDPHDIDAWYETNPSLGLVLTERKIKAEIGDDIVDFNIQRLGLWYEKSLASAISENEWNVLRIEKPEFKVHKLFVGIKFGVDGTNVALSIAGKTVDEKVFVELVDCRSMRDGITWITDWLYSAKSVNKIAIDGANGTLLVKAMHDLHLKAPILPTVKEIITANSEFEQAVFREEISHCGQEPLKDVITHCEKRNIGSNGGFGYKSQTDTLEIAMMDSVILAHWLCKNTKETVQRIR